MSEQSKQLWIGVVEVRPLNGKSSILGDVKGAFVNIVTWATNAEEYRRKAELVIEGVGGLFISEVVDPEPVDALRAKLPGGLEEEIEDAIARAEANSNAIIYGTFHGFEKDDA